MVDGRPNHSRHRGNRFEHDRAIAVALGEEGIRAEAQHLGEGECDPVGHTFRLMVNSKIYESKQTSYISTMRQRRVRV